MNSTTFTSLTANPNSVYPVTSVVGYSDVFVYGDLGYGVTSQERKEQDMDRNERMFAHFARMFVERFTGWELVPDAKDPFKRIQVFSKDGKYIITNNYPSNDLSITASTPEAQYHLNESMPQFSSMGINCIPTPYFYGWALGMEDIPKFLSEYKGDIV